MITNVTKGFCFSVMVCQYAKHWFALGKGYQQLVEILCLVAYGFTGVGVMLQNCFCCGELIEMVL
jgi:hypothetical protein